MKKLNDILETIQQLFDNLKDNDLALEKTLQTALQKLTVLVRADYSNIILLQHDKEHFAVAAASRSFYERTLDKEILVKHFGELIQNNKPVFLNKTSALVQEQCSANSVSIPIKENNQVLGFLNLIRVKGDLFNNTDLKIVESIADYITMAIMKKKLREKNSNEHLKFTQSLACIVDARDQYTREHSMRVNRYSLMIALKMGLPHHTFEQLRIASLLHDMGKIGVPDSILLKPDNLTQEEFEVIKTHPVIGANILREHTQFKNIVPCVLHHHERWDGQGYPHNLTREKIPLGARIISVADAFEAMTANRPYRQAMEQKQATTELIQQAGTQFDPQVVQAFVECLKNDI